MPTSFPDGDDVDARSWASRQAADQRSRGFAEDDTSGTLDQYFLEVVEAARASGDHESFWALVAVDAPGFVAVTLDVRRSEGPLDRVLAPLVAHRDYQYEPAAHVVTQAAGLGEGVNVVRLDVDEQGRVYQSVYYVFRADGSDYIVSTHMYDTAALGWAVPHILELVDGIDPSVAA